MFSHYDLTNKIVVVTGGSGGLGEQICYEAAKKGAIVVVCARRVDQIEKIKTMCNQFSGRSAYAFQLDITDPKSIDYVIENIQKEIGFVDILVNSAGFGVFKNFIDIDQETIKQMFEVNVLGMMVFTQKIAVGMAEKRQGAIINIASMAGKIATAKSTIYSATKFAIIGFSNALRMELKPLGIHVMTVNPGPIRTHFFDKADPSGEYLDALGHFVLDPNELAKFIVKSMGTKKREINRPRIMEGAARLYTWYPHFGDWIVENLFDKKYAK